MIAGIIIVLTVAPLRGQNDVAPNAPWRTMQERTLTLIFNPMAGQLNTAARINDVAGFWQANGWRVFVRPTQHAGHATELAREAAERQHQLVLAAGGDGTINQVANGLVGSESILGPLPVGTANALARELGLPRPNLLEPDSLLRASRLLVDGHVQRMDLNRVETGKVASHALLWTGIGADGFLVQQLEPRPIWSKRLGPVGYSIQALSVMHRLPAMAAVVQIDDLVIEDDFLLIVISNSRLYAGGLVELSARASLDDGQFEVWLFRSGLPARRSTAGHRLGRMARYMTQVRLNIQDVDPGMSCVTGRRVTLETRPKMPCHIDGDSAGYTPLTCEIVPGALQVLVPAAGKGGLFTLPGRPIDA